MIELSDCPFCGGKAHYITQRFGSEEKDWAQCSACSASAVVDVWKKRVGDSLAEQGRIRLRHAEVMRALGDLLLWFNNDGSPCDGFRMREEAIMAREVFNTPARKL